MIRETGTPTIAVTMGDPAGVGPEIVLKALSAPEIQSLASWVVVGDRVALEKAAATCGISPTTPGAKVQDLGMFQSPEQFTFGELNGKCGRAALEYVRRATQMCLSGEAQAMVTAPLNKEAVTLSGTRFSGHTEYIAELCGAPESRMLLASRRLSVVHVTTHIALRKALDPSSERILRTIELGNEAMKLLGVERPRIAMCGLNPHAGEDGYLGREEIEIIAPALAALREQGIAVAGPLPADTVFVPAKASEFDCVIAMYHDQGLPVLKHASFGHGVNVTLGLPIVRTSVDHGTALDLAADGTGARSADPGSLFAAVALAIELTQRAPMIRP